MIPINFIIRYLTVFLVIVSCTQLVGRYFNLYYLLDELLLVGLVLLVLLKKENFKIKSIQLYLYGALFCVILINFVLNFYSSLAFLIKTGYYFKSILPFIVLPICSKYLKKKDFYLIYKFLLFLVVISFVEYYYLEFVDIYTFGKDLPFKIRNGSYRAMSITGHPISFGTLCFVGIIISKEVLKIKNFLPYILFSVALFLSQSRIPQLFLIIYLLYVIRNLKLRLVFNKFLYFKMLFITAVPILFIALLLLPQYFESTKEDNTTRLIAIKKSLNVLKNPVNLIFGTGIGSFGTYESVIYQSEVYNEMDFPEHYKGIVLKNKSTGVETFLVMILVELGILGFIIYYLIFLNFINTTITELKLFLTMIMILYTLVYPLYTFPFVFLINVFFPKMDKRIVL